MHYIKFIVGWLLWLVALCASAVAPVATINNLDKPFDLAPYIEFIEDPQHEYTLEAIRSGQYDHLWMLNKERAFIGRNYKSQYWFRVKLRWQIQDEAYLLTDNHAGLISHLRLTLAQLGREQVINSGISEPYTQRNMLGHFYGVHFSAQPDTDLSLTGLLDNQNIALPAILPLRIYSAHGFQALQEQRAGILIGFYTVMAALLFYNLCLFLTLRQSVYGLYIGFLLSAVLGSAFIDGTASRFLFPDSPILCFIAANINGFLVNMLYCAFVYSALDTSKHWPGAVLWYRGLMGLGLFIAGISLVAMDFANASLFSQVYAALAVPVSLIAIVIATKQKLPTAPYLLVAECCTVIGATSFMLVIQGILPITRLSLWSMHAGFVAEALLLSLALAARTRLAQKAAIDHLQQYENLYESSVQGLFQFNLLNNSLKCNDAFAKLFGFNSKEDIIHSDFSEKKTLGVWANKDLMKPLFSNGHVTNYETPLLSEVTNEEIWVSINMQLIYDEQGTPVFMDGSFNNINERKLKENETNKRALAESANAAKSQFFASMSHEFRTPLTAILGYSEVAMPPDADPALKQNSLETINRSGKHLLQLINDILDLSKIEAQKLEVESLDVNVIEILHDIHDYFSILAEKKRISFNISYQFPLPETITSDPTRLKQTLINICGNAVKFTEAGGVTLHVACDNEKQIMQFAIQDTGIGLKPDQVNKLFSAFTQADTATTRNFGGTGLGLHLSKQIAQKLGGDITVESEFGKGSTFTITVATGLLNNVTWLESLPAQVNHSHQAITIPQFAGHILYAEDNPQNQELVSTFVSQTGATIDVVGNGQKALALAQAKQFDLIFTDIRMPTLDGVEFTRTLLTVKPHLPIVAITAAATEHELEEFIAAGFKRILRKPIDRKMLYEVMAEYLPVRNANGTKESEEKSKPLRVLLAEDNIENQALIKIYLKRAGTATIIANDGVEALQIVGREEIDLVLMDMQMPHMDGLTAVRYLRGKGFDKPIYALTANETAEAIQACIDAGCDGHLSKPLDTAQLNELITRIKG